MANDSTANVTEIVRFYDFKLDDAEGAAFKLVKGLDGCLRSYHGVEVNVSGNGVWVQDWRSLADHTAFQTSAIYPSFTAGIAAFAKAEHDIVHVQFQPYPAERAFTAPFTEVTIATLKSTTTRETHEAVIQEALENATGLDRLSYGVVLEDAKQYAIVNGWESVEAYQEALSNAQVFKKLNEIAALDSRLYKWTE